MALFMSIIDNSCASLYCSS